MRTKFQQAMVEHVNACFTGIYVQTSEPEEALREIVAAGADLQWRVATFDLEEGTAEFGSHGDRVADPQKALQDLRSKGMAGEGATLLVMPYFNRIMDDVAMLPTLQRTLTMGKQSRTFVVVMAPIVKIPVELEKLFVVIEHDLPDASVLGAMLETMRTDMGLPELSDDERKRIIDAAAGLTRSEADSAFALSLARHARFDASVLWELKAGMLKKAGTLELYRGGERFSDLGGLDGIKSFCTKALGSKSMNAKPRGVMLLGVPGAGKSAFAKALGNETGRPTVTLDFGALMGSLVGQTEENTRRALRIVDAMAPCVLFVDEIEKGLSGASGSGSNDSGVSSRMLGTLLTWLNDHTSDVFFIGTCNDIKSLASVSSGAFVRAERFDGVFFVDLPDESQRSKIWTLYRDKYGLLGDETLTAGTVDDSAWTGAEIKACCRLSSLLGETIEQAAKRVIPIARTASKSIADLREWAVANALDANTGAGYVRPNQRPVESSQSRRVVKPSQN